MINNAIKINNLTIPPAFKNFSLIIPSGKLISISGPNNCGKTTLIRILDRQLPSGDSILLFGQNLSAYKVYDHTKIIKTVIPEEIQFTNNTLEQELASIVESFKYESPEDKMIYKHILKKLKLLKYQKSNLSHLDKQTIIKVQLLFALSALPKVLLLDDIFKSFSQKEKKYLLSFLKEFQLERSMTIVFTTSNLEESLFCDYLYIIDNNEIILQGEPMKILQKDNVLNRAGLRLPFMIDLSVKLRDYDLISDIELDMDRMVEFLWK